LRALCLTQRHIAVFGTVKCGGPVVAALGRFGVIYNGAKSAGTVLQVF
jgi:hypothetical protein